MNLKTESQILQELVDAWTLVDQYKPELTRLRAENEALTASCAHAGTVTQGLRAENEALREVLSEAADRYELSDFKHHPVLAAWLRKARAALGQEVPK